MRMNRSLSNTVSWLVTGALAIAWYALLFFLWKVMELVLLDLSACVDVDYRLHIRGLSSWKLAWGIIALPPVTWLMAKARDQMDGYVHTIVVAANMVLVLASLCLAIESFRNIIGPDDWRQYRYSKRLEAEIHWNPADTETTSTKNGK